MQKSDVEIVERFMTLHEVEVTLGLVRVGYILFCVIFGPTLSDLR